MPIRTASESLTKAGKSSSASGAAGSTASATQKNRPVAFNSPLGPDKLLLVSMTAHERLSAPFRFDVDLASDDNSIDFDKVLGHPASIRLETAGAGTRYFHGIVAALSQLPHSGGYA